MPLAWPKQNRLWETGVGALLAGPASFKNSRIFIANPGE